MMMTPRQIAPFSAAPLMISSEPSFRFLLSFLSFAVTPFVCGQSHHAAEHD
jgi:hypothetical protein